MCERDRADQAAKEASRQGARTDLHQERDAADAASRQPNLLDNKNSDVKEVKGWPDGNKVEYALRRLRKDRPDLHQRVLAGELTANAAVVEGFLGRE